MENQRENVPELEIEETEEKENALESLLSKVDLNDPVLVDDARGNEVAITKEQFISYYMPPTASQLEAFHCFQQVRASGLNLLIPGECYFFKTGEGPVQMFTGYKAYLRLAYANGLVHIQQPELVFDEITGLPVSCTITLEIEGRENFTWTTWYSEVVGESQGKPNKRWLKAPNQMTIKCSVTNTLRMSGLADFSLPYVVEEMGDPVADGFRTLTEEQLDAHGVETDRWKAAPHKMVDKERFEEAILGTVDAADHQVDLSPFRKTYFGALEKRVMLWEDSDRRTWQEEQGLPASTSDWTVEDYAKAMDIIHTIPIPEPAEVDQSGADEFLDNEPDVPIEHAEEAAQPETPAEPAEGDEPFLITDDTVAALNKILLEFENQKELRGIKSSGFHKFAETAIEHPYVGLRKILDSDGILILNALKVKLALERSETQEPATAEPQQPTDDEITNGDGKCTDDQYNEIADLFAEWMPDKVDAAGKSVALGTGIAQAFMRGNVPGYAGVRLMTEAQADDVILALQDRNTDATEPETA